MGGTVSPEEGVSIGWMMAFVSLVAMGLVDKAETGGLVGAGHEDGQRCGVAFGFRRGGLN